MTVVSKCCQRHSSRRHVRHVIQVLREAKQAPQEIQNRIAQSGGANRFGEANFRLVWGWSRLTWIGGKWTDRDASGNILRECVELRQEPKYAPCDRWYIERWMPPETYGSPESWYSQTREWEHGIAIPALGPFPSRGEYEHCFTLCGSAGEFIPLSASACEAVVRAVEWTRSRPSRLSLCAIRAREQARRRSWNSFADDVLGDALPAFHGHPFVNVAVT